jgi:hypothetical protein
MLELDEGRFRLTIPLFDAMRFAIGSSDLDYDEPSDVLRQLVGLLAIDALQYSEQWRVAASLRCVLARKWPDLEL